MVQHVNRESIEPEFQGSAERTAASAIVVFDIDGVVRDVGGSYRRALADTVEHFTQGFYRPSQTDIDALKSEGVWNNDWEASRELVYRYFEARGKHRGGAAIPGTSAEPAGDGIALDYEELVRFFQARYRGPDPEHWTGYICQEPLLMQPAYLEQLTQAGIPWGFCSGATTGSARYVLEKRLCLQAPVLVAMEDAPGKPDPTGLLATVQLLEPINSLTPVIYVGDTVADMYTVENARQLQPTRRWIGVGVLPPHVQDSTEQSRAYAAALERSGAQLILDTVQALIPEQIQALLGTTSP